MTFRFAQAPQACEELAQCIHAILTRGGSWWRVVHSLPVADSPHIVMAWGYFRGVWTAPTSERIGRIKTVCGQLICNGFWSV